MKGGDGGCPENLMATVSRSFYYDLEHGGFNRRPGFGDARGPAQGIHAHVPEEIFSGHARGGRPGGGPDGRPVELPGGGEQDPDSSRGGAVSQAGADRDPERPDSLQIAQGKRRPGCGRGSTLPKRDQEAAGVGGVQGAAVASFVGDLAGQRGKELRVERKIQLATAERCGKTLLLTATGGAD